MNNSLKRSGALSLIRIQLCVVLIACGHLVMLGCQSKPPLAEYPELSMAVTIGDPPRSIAVLPFVNRTEAQGLDALVRTSFYSHLSVRSYRDVELHAVDRRLRQLPGDDRRAISEIPPERLGRLLGCDALVYGEVTEFQRVYAALYSQLAIGASITIRDARGGGEIWKDQHVVRLHEGGVPLNPLSIPFISLRSGMNLRPSVKIKAVDQLARYLARRIPAPKSTPSGMDADQSNAYELQAGAFLENQRAGKLLGRLRESGYPAFIRLNRDERGLWSRVLMGPYESSDEALRLQKEVHEELGIKPIIERVPPKSTPLAEHRR